MEVIKISDNKLYAIEIHQFLSNVLSMAIAVHIAADAPDQGAVVHYRNFLSLPSLNTG